MPDLPPHMPRPMRQLRKDSVGRPVPFFVEWVDGKPDFRIMSGAAYNRAVRFNLCWICGQELTKAIGTFVAGPMCLVNGTSPEPPSHYACAEWSARACPFLNNPDKGRREANLPEDWTDAAGIAIKRNPGVTALISTRYWWPFKPEGGGVLIHFDRPHAVEWLCEGRTATAEEVCRSINTGLPNLYVIANEQGPEAVESLSQKTAAAMKWVPDL